MLKTLDVALKVIKMFTKEKPEWGGRELANTMNMDHAKIYRILETFEANSFISKDPITKKYTLGFSVLELGMIKYEGLNLKGLINPVLEDLMEKTGESTFLTTLYNNEAMTLVAIESENKVKYTGSVGSRAPLYVGASYRAILANLPDEFIHQYLDSQSLVQYTERTITNKAKLLEELQNIKENGWALSKGEYTPDIIAMAVPVFDGIKGVVGSITVAGPSYRFSEEKINQYLPLLLKTRDDIQEIIEKYQIKLQF
ncbi:IclR family transcriptional regulator [Bacillus sp. JJ1533]|uniref:IclR family transcriptional regulator n=1 Tax=Bacillus sp. JJ1533 TaxID=3122959 RepID=UPI002FFDC15B